MANFKNDIEIAANNDPIDSFVIGPTERFSPTDRKIEQLPRGVILDWDKYKNYFDFQYDAGYGGVDVPAVYLWTNDYVLFVVEYDGSSWISKVPRNPVECGPSTHGGG